MDIKDGFVVLDEYKKGDMLPNGLFAKCTMLKIKHSYCESEYIKRRNHHISRMDKCPHCCGSYENSFVHHIEVELGLKLGDVWDFEKNIVDPYHISKGIDKKIWIKCQGKDYHGSYEVRCSSFYGGSTCPYCHSKKIHPRDSFAQYHIDNTDKDFLEKYWDYERNTLDPWEISVSSKKMIWIKCQNEEVNELNGLMKKDYHESYEIRSQSFTSGARCSKCASKTIHLYGSFGYKVPYLSHGWNTLNDNSPYSIAVTDKSIYKFICPKCDKEFNRSVLNAIKYGVYCRRCNMSSGETEIYNWLRYNNIEYEYEKTFKGLVGTGSRKLSYDFYIPTHNLLIEFQGNQHKEYTSLWHKSYKDFEKQLEHDKRKREYAKEHNIKLIEIWEEYKDNIEEILQKEIIDSNKLI